MGEQYGYRPYPKEFETFCIHQVKRVRKTEKLESPFLTPLKLSNVSKSDEPCDNNMPGEYVKARIANPTRLALEKLLALINKAKYALAFSSGMGAITAVFGLLRCSDHVICSDDVYGGTNHLLKEVMSKFGVTHTFVDFYDLEKVKEAITPKTKLIWTENPTNPCLKVIDICKTAAIAQECNITLCTDNSFLTPYLQAPLELGADIAVQAIAKYINGHSDVVMGCVATNRQDLYDRLQFVQTHFGHVPSPFDCYQVIRGIKTLPLRMQRHHINSLKVAEFLSTHPRIEGVIHPGPYALSNCLNGEGYLHFLQNVLIVLPDGVPYRLRQFLHFMHDGATPTFTIEVKGHPSHPKHELFKCQTSGHCGVVCCYVKGTAKQTTKFMRDLKLFNIALSLGGYESLLQMPYTMSHHMVPEETKRHLGITPNLIRMSIGLENIEDIIEDLHKALCKL